MLASTQKSQFQKGWENIEKWPKHPTHMIDIPFEATLITSHIIIDHIASDETLMTSHIIIDHIASDETLITCHIIIMIDHPAGCCQRI